MTDTILLTGLTGYIAKHTAAQLLAAGHAVRASVRSKERGARTVAALAAYGADTSRLELVEADLLADAGWSEAAAGCRFVLHTASPFPLQMPKDRMALVPEAKEGTLRVLRAAKKAGAERVVLTSSFVSIIGGQPVRPGHVWTEEDWADTDSPTINAYRLSKALAERAAWEEAKSTGLDLVAINPTFVMGPGIGSDLGASLTVFKLYLEGKYPGVPKLAFPVVDVRDVAAAHVAAMTAKGAPGRRFLATADGVVTLTEVGRIIGEALPAYAKKMPRFELPDWAVRLLARFDATLATVVPDLGRTSETASNRAAREILGVTFRPAKESIVDSAKSVERILAGR